MERTASAGMQLGTRRESIHQHLRGRRLVRLPIWPLPSCPQKPLLPQLAQTVSFALINCLSATLLDANIELVLHHSQAFKDAQAAEFVHGI